MSTELPGDIVVPQMSILIDGTAGTMITGYRRPTTRGEPAPTSSATTSPTSATTGSTRASETAVIGVGGGRDVLSALEFDADRVTGIEINNNILDIVTNKLGDFTNLECDPRVRLVNDEARSWLTRSDDQFDMIQMSLIDTWAASSAGRLRPVGELALHDRRVEHVLRPHRRRRDAVGVPVVLAGRPPAVRDAAHRGPRVGGARPSAASRTRATTC